MMHTTHYTVFFSSVHVGLYIHDINKRNDVRFILVHFNLMVSSTCRYSKH